MAPALRVFVILSRLSVAMSLAVMAVIFVLDLRVPLGVTVYYLYVLPILISLLADNLAATRQLAWIGTTLVALGFVFSPHVGVPPWIVAGDGVRDYIQTVEARLAWNRIMAVVVVWITAILGWEMASAKQQLRQMEKILVICAWTKQVKADGRWMPVEEYLTEQLGVRLSHGISREAVERLLQDEGLDVR